MHTNWFVGISAFGALLSALVKLLRLGMRLDWPVILKYERWEYAVGIISGVLWFAWGCEILSRL